jgi:iron complex outermembrane receptor protein
MLNVRGYTLDNRYNYRREGFPINAETMIPLENKERIELFKGTSGIQAGTSAPGGMANYVVKRPPNSVDNSIRSLTLSYGNGNNTSSALDLGGRFGEKCGSPPPSRLSGEQTALQNQRHRWGVVAVLGTPTGPAPTP